MDSRQQTRNSQSSGYRGTRKEAVGSRRKPNATGVGAVAAAAESPVGSKKLSRSSSGKALESVSIGDGSSSITNGNAQTAIGVHDKRDVADLQIKSVKKQSQLGAVLEDVQIEPEGGQQAIQDGATLDSVAIEELDNLKLGVKRQRSDNSPDPEKQELNKGHYEKKSSGVLLWGFVLCCCVLMGPLGGGFAFVLTPAQFASFGLIVFWKKGQKKVWKVDKNSMPGDRLITQKSIDKMLNAVQNGGDKMLTPIENPDKLLAQMMESIPQDQRDQAARELAEFSSVIEALAKANGVEQKAVDEISGVMKNLATTPTAMQTLKGSEFDRAFSEFIVNESESDRRSIAERIIKSFSEVMQKITPDAEQFKDAKLLLQLRDNDPDAAKKAVEALVKSRETIKEKMSAFAAIKSSQDQRHDPRDIKSGVVSSKPKSITR